MNYSLEHVLTIINNYLDVWRQLFNKKFRPNNISKFWRKEMRHLAKSLKQKSRLIYIKKFNQSKST